MLNIFVIISRHTGSKCINLVRTRTSTTYTNIESEMKKLNDREEFAKVLTLFDTQKYKEMSSDRVVVQALKACTRLGYLERGKIIHKKLSNRSLNNTYIQATLIHFYSEFIVELVIFEFLLSNPSDMRSYKRCSVYF
jgi:hypothetical protein